MVTIPTDYTVSCIITILEGSTTYTYNNVIINLQGDNSKLLFGSNRFDFGQSAVQSVRESKSSGLTSIVMPFQNSSENMSWDYLGVARDYTLDGTVVGTPEAITRFVWLFNQILDGSQFEHEIYLTYKYGRAMNRINGTLSNSAKKIIFKDFVTNYEKSTEGMLNYTLTFEEGKRD